MTVLRSICVLPWNAGIELNFSNKKESVELFIEHYYKNLSNNHPNQNIFNNEGQNIRKKKENKQIWN